MKKTVFIYGFSLAVLIILLKYFQYRYIMLDLKVEVYAGIIAVLFTLVGIWAGGKIIAPKTEVKEVLIPVISNDFSLNETAIQNTGISKRELEVLQLKAEGYSNQEIAGKIFISLSTVKTHVAGIFLKLNAKRRTDAIRIAQEMKIIR